MPSAADNVRQEHIEVFIADLLAHWRPSTASNRYRALQAFWKWCLEEWDLKASPIAHMRPPRVPEESPLP